MGVIKIPASECYKLWKRAAKVTTKPSKQVEEKEIRPIIDDILKRKPYLRDELMSTINKYKLDVSNEYLEAGQTTLNFD